MEIKSGTFIPTICGLEPAKHVNGFYVALAGLETVISRNVLTEELVQNITAAYEDLALQNYGFVGIWESDNDVYFDVSQHIEDKNHAIETGRARDQKAIWDIAKGEEIRLASTPFTFVVTRNGVNYTGISNFSLSIARSLAFASANKAQFNSFVKD